MSRLINLRKKAMSVIAVVTILSFLSSVCNLSILIGTARAAQLNQVKDTLSDSDLSVKSNHTVSFTSKSSISGSNTIVIDFADDFTTSSPNFSNTDANDYDIATSTADLSVVATGSCATSGVPMFEITSISTANTFTFTHCDGTNAIPANTPITIEIGTHATTGGTGDSQLTNPGVAASYLVTVTAPTADSAVTRVAIIDDVVVTASVGTNFTFTVAGVAAGQNINGDAETTASGATATALPFGELTSGAAKVLGQTLSVSTNAKNGFVVTVQQDQNLLSGNGADIDLFKDGSAVATPEAWAVPSNTLDSEATYGHYGITSEDADLNSDEFGTALYAGNFSSDPRVVFSHTGPANGSTANKGQTRVGYKIEIGSLQEAANDYTNSLTYVATPTF